MDIVETLELERRWLLCESATEAPAVLKSLKLLLAGCKSEEIKQWYISLNPVLRLRSHDDSEFVFCVKTKGKHVRPGIPEKESELNRDEFDNLMKLVINKNPLRKPRHYISIDGGLTAELDVFCDYFLGLIIVEVEFKDEESYFAFVPPAWFGNNEITGNKDYANSTLYSLMPDSDSNQEHMQQLAELLYINLKANLPGYETSFKIEIIGGPEIYHLRCKGQINPYMDVNLRIEHSSMQNLYWVVPNNHTTIQCKNEEEAILCAIVEIKKLKTII